jgi:ABC-type Mn2+/Zn2+ transport system permease subunit
MGFSIPILGPDHIVLLVLCGIILAVNLPLIGGLIIFSIITCPAAAAYQICTITSAGIFALAALYRTIGNRAD